MAYTNTTTKNYQGRSNCESEAPCCEECGAIECLCRPRFFAGQLLTEQDLNRLDQYIKNKNRLHNRNQHGWGVVNGLKVLCDPCGQVKVTEGYAIDPCGDDIVVCQQTPVNICDLINKCRQTEQTPNCDPFQYPPNSQCEDIEEEWVLTIKYREMASRGVTALRGNTCHSSSVQKNTCSCGQPSCSGSCNNASYSCNTGCGGNKNKAPSLKGAYRGAPTECEPTVICEGYSFDVYPKPERDIRDDDDDRLVDLEGSFWDAFNCCAEKLIATVPPMPDLENNDNLVDFAVAISQWCCKFKANLIKYYTTQPNTSCEIIDYLNAIVCPSLSNPDNFLQDFVISFLSLFVAWLEGIKICICLALLPPTPEATCDTRVPLATVKIRMKDCKVLSICNWTTERKIMVTWPAIGHWLGIFSIGKFLHKLMDSFCCNSLLDLFDNVLLNYPYGDQSFNQGRGDIADAEASDEDELLELRRASEEQQQPLSFAKALDDFSKELSSRFKVNLGGKSGTGFSQLISAGISRGDKPLQLGAILNKISPRFKLPTNGQELNYVESNNIPLLLASEIVAKPIMANFLGPKEASTQVEEFIKGFESGKEHNEKQKGEAAKGTADMEANLKQQMKVIQQQLNMQKQEISALKKQLQSSNIKK